MRSAFPPAVLALGTVLLGSCLSGACGGSDFQASPLADGGEEGHGGFSSDNGGDGGEAPLGGASGSMNTSGGAGASSDDDEAGASPGGSQGGAGGALACPVGSLDCNCRDAGTCESGLVCQTGICRAQIGCVEAGLIDDLEDQNTALCPNGRRDGFWFIYWQSATGSVLPDDAAQALWPLTNDPHGGAASAWGLRLAGSDFGNVLASDFAAIGFSFRSEAAAGASPDYDLSAYSGLSFWAKGTQGLKIRLNVTTRASRGSAQNGTCLGTNCNDHFGKFIDISPTWTLYTVSFATLAQQGWGTVVMKDLAHAGSVDFLYVGELSSPSLTFDNPSTFELLIDDVKLL